MKWFAAALVAIDEPDKQRSLTNAGMQLLKDLKCFRNETRFENKILRRIARQREFRRKHQIGTRSHQTFVSPQNSLRIAFEIANCGIELSKTNFHAP